MEDLVHCIYTSVQTHVLSPAEMGGLMQHSREKNAQRHITGLLLHVGASFFQVLEGPRKRIDELYQRIVVDSRHTHITRIIYEPIARRFFANASMMLLTLPPQEVSAALKLGDLEHTETMLAELDEGRAKRLLRAFSKGRWRARLQPELEEERTMA